MNKFIFILFLTLINVNLYAQLIMAPYYREFSNSTVIDSTCIRITYLLNSAECVIDDCEDMHILEIGENTSKYYSYFVYRSDSLIHDFIKKNPKAKTLPQNMLEKGKVPYWSECYKNFSENIFTEYVRTPPNISNYQYSEQLPVQNWKIQNDTTRILGFLCQKAICDFRGRTYIAWFTTDIPLNNGPWKFGGLPGLILKINDSQNEFVFECIGIENSISNKRPVTKPKYNEYHKSDRKTVLKLQRKIQKNYFMAAGFSSENMTVNGMPPEQFQSVQEKMFPGLKPKYNTLLLELDN